MNGSRPLLMREYIGLAFFAALLSLPLFRYGLGQLHMQATIWLLYALGLTVPLFLIRKPSSLLFERHDFLIMGFVVLYLASSFYTIADEYRQKFILISIIPLYYYNAKIVMRRGAFSPLMWLLLVITLAYSVYVVFWMQRTGFDYHYFVHYSKALFKTSYLDLTLYTVTLTLFLITKPKFRLLDLLLAGNLVFVTLISGSRFSIIFMILVMVILAPALVRRLNSAGLSKILVLVFCALVLAGSFFMIDNFERITSLFDYTVKRMTSLVNNDNSVAERVALIGSSLSAANRSFFLGSGINSSEIVLGASYSHNMILETLVETGILNATVLSTALVYGMSQAVRGLGRSDISLFVALSYGYLCISYLKSFSVTDSRMLILFLGASLICGRRRRRADSTATKSDGSRYEFSRVNESGW